MEVLYEKVCGIDVHKSSVAACILLERGHRPQKHLLRSPDHLRVRDDN